MIGISKAMVEVRSESRAWAPVWIQRGCGEVTVPEGQENLRLDSTWFCLVLLTQQKTVF